MCQRKNATGQLETTLHNFKRFGSTSNGKTIYKCANKTDKGECSVVNYDSRKIFSSIDELMNELKIATVTLF